MRVVVAGSGTASPDARRVCSAYVVEELATRILLDCGPGAVHGLARADVSWTAITHLGITHFHNDHIGDLPFLFFAWKYGMRPTRTAPLQLFGPPGLKAFIGALPDALGAHVRSAGFKVDVYELQHGAPFPLAPGLTVTAHTTPHTAASLAYRIDGATGSVGYTGDTGPNDELGEFFRGVSLLIAECSLPDVEAVATHLSPTSVARLARLAQPKQLLLTHVYPQLERLTLPALVRAAGWSGDTLLADDGLTVSF